MKKVTILSLHLGYGGIEKAVCDLANNLVHDYNVEIISVYKLYDESPHYINPTVKINYLMDGTIALKTDRYKKCICKCRFIKLFGELFKDYRFNIFSLTKDTFLSLKSIINKRRLVKKYIQKSDSDFLISTRDYLNKVLGKSDNKALKIAWEHNHHHNNKKYFNKIIKSCKNIDKLVLVSKNLYQDYYEKMKTLKCQCVYIPNMIDIDNPVLSKLDSKTLINVSRFSKEKGLFDLIDVIYLVKNENINIKLNLIGDGSLRKEIEDYINKKGLQNNILLHGYKSSEYVHDVLCKSSLYVMTSYTESFGISLLESFSHGVPAIAFDSAEGATELINKNNGLLISNRDTKEMAKQIVLFLNDTKKLKELSKGALDVYHGYIPEKVIKLWKNILK